MRAANILASATGVMELRIPAHFQTVSECRQDMASGSEGEMDDVIEVIYYHLFSRLQDAECSWHHHIPGKQSAYHLELRGCSSCRKELRLRQPPAQSGPGQLPGASFPTRPTTSLLHDPLTPARPQTPLPWNMLLPPLEYPSPPLQPQIIWAGLWVPLLRLRQMSLLCVPSLPWIHPTVHDVQGI